MKKMLKYLGLPLVYLGILWLVVCYFTSWSNSNTMLLIGVILIIIGIITYVIKIKKESEY